MDKLHLLAPKERLPYFEKAAEQMGVTIPLIEKDYWVVWVLGRLFNIAEIKDHLTFKGGTSLSKVYHLIKRFSEDVDLSIEKSFFGFSEDKFPEHFSNRKQRSISLEQLSQECGKYVQNSLLKSLSEDFSKELNSTDGWILKIDETDDTKQTLLFDYPAVTTARTGYIQPSVKIELGARAEHWPVSYKSIQSYAKELVNEQVEEPAVTVKVLNVERTFWEKATILHQYANIPPGKRLPLRLSRHYYDFYRLLNSSAKSAGLANQDLLEKVAKHKEVYFPSTWAKYPFAKKGSLKLAPPDSISDELGRDYQAMREMFFEDPAAWSEVVEGIKLFEREFNS